MAETLSGPNGAPVTIVLTEPITIGRFAVTLNPKNSIHPGEVFAVTAEIQAIMYTWTKREVWRYSVGWDSYQVTGSANTRKEAFSKAWNELITFQENWYKRGDEVTKITILNREA